MPASVGDPGGGEDAYQCRACGAGRSGRDQRGRPHPSWPSSDLLQRMQGRGGVLGSAPGSLQVSVGLMYLIWLAVYFLIFFFFYLSLSSFQCFLLINCLSLDACALARSVQLSLVGLSSVLQAFGHKRKYWMKMWLDERSDDCHSLVFFTLTPHKRLLQTSWWSTQLLLGHFSLNKALWRHWIFTRQLWPIEFLIVTLFWYPLKKQKNIV